MYRRSGSLEESSGFISSVSSEILFCYEYGAELLIPLPFHAGLQHLLFNPFFTCQVEFFIYPEYSFFVYLANPNRVKSPTY